MLSEDEYRALCEDCDTLLAESGYSLCRVAIAWLHVLNEHPSNLAHYRDVLSDGHSGGILRWRALLGQARAWFADSPSGWLTGADPADVVFVSHLLNAGQVGQEDFYFGRLPELLRERGLETCVVLRNATRESAHGLTGGWNSDMAPRVVLPSAATLRQELRLRRDLGREARIVRASERKTVPDLLRRNAVRHALSHASLASLRFYYQFVDLLRRVRPRAVVLTYEGHAWERLAFAAARSIDANIRRIGYHHTIMFPRQHAAVRPLSDAFDPDLVLTAGTVTAARFKAAFQQTGTRVGTLGIHRRMSSTQVASGDKSTCLFVPDGVETEVARLFDFAVAAAKLAPDVPFVMRFHPVVSVRRLRKRYPHFADLPSNLSISCSSIDDDVARARWVVYRGSNAAVYAVIAGARPIYVAVSGELHIDALAELNAWKEKVSTPDELSNLVTTDLSADKSEHCGAREAAVRFCEQYFVPASPDALLEAIYCEQS
jgi:hypothetical protein